MQSYLLIDGLNLLHRSRHVVRGDGFEKAGLSVSIAINSIKWAWNTFDADHVVFCFDGRSWRKKFFEDYKANRAVIRLKQSTREKEEDAIFFQTADDLTQFIEEHTNCTVLKSSILEADDLIAGWIQKYDNNDNLFTIVSTDSDYVQLLSPTVQIYDGVNKKLYKHDGMFDEKFRPFKDKKGNKLPAINPEYALFEKCIRGDTSDNVPSAYPGVRTKSSKKSVGIDEAFEDRHNQGFAWVNFMKSRWTDPFGNEHTVEKDFQRNQILIDLTKQPQEIKDEIENTINEAIKKQRNTKMIGLQFMKFCARHELVKLAENSEAVVQMFSSKLIL